MRAANPPTKFAAGGVIAQQPDGPGRVHVIGAEHHDELAGGQGQAIVEGVVKAVVGGRNVIVEDVVKSAEKVAGTVGRSVEDNVLDIRMATDRRVSARLSAAFNTA